MTIINTNLITAYSARQDGKKVLTVINGNRKISGAHFNSYPSSLIIDFREEISWCDITLENKNYTGFLSFAGLGLEIKNLIPSLPNLTRFTYRLNFPKLAKGKINITSNGGDGEIILYNISGFVSNE